ncbi:unnamed protein product [Hymenolepis diminuta]|uniref:Abl interactor 1-like n=1 Tax=Hymenolepis diminuta TaxID=6216 RepID=A0A0R3SJR7_HYMDI|nr:unnamed protein product [Hymenolepis diminuta]
MPSGRNVTMENKPEQSIVLEPLEMGNQPPAVPPHQNLVLANPDEFHSTISQESNPTVMAPVSSSPMTISKSLLPTSNVMRRPAPRPPVNTAQRSPPSPPVTMAANNPISQNFTAIANGIIADPLKDDSMLVYV